MRYSAFARGSLVARTTIGLLTLIGIGSAAPPEQDVGGSSSPLTIPLRPGVPTGASGPAPTLTLYRPSADRASGAAMVVCPGGGYGGLAEHEGKPIAEWFNSLGITAVVLKYRLGPQNHHPAMLDDASRAIRTTRANATAWGIDPRRVGIIGFSAGGHLAATAATHFDAGDPTASDPIDRLSSRPDRLILLYPVISMRAGITHNGSRQNLLGPDPSPELVDLLSNETQVKADTSPAFIVHTDADEVVLAENSLLFVMALRQAHVPVEFHLFEKGAHGLGLGQGRNAGLPYSEWTQLCAKWLNAQGFLKSRP